MIAVETVCSMYPNNGNPATEIGSRFGGNLEGRVSVEYFLGRLEKKIFNIGSPYRHFYSARRSVRIFTRVT